MSEEKNDTEKKEDTSQPIKETVEQDNKPAESLQEKTEENQKDSQVEKTSDEEINWKKFRQKRTEEKQARLKAEQEAAILKTAISELIEKEKPAKTTDYYEDDDENNRIKKLINESFKDREATEFPKKLRQAYPDFDKVCTHENIDYLEYKDPELSTALKHMPDGFEKWALVYSSLKKKLPTASIEESKQKMQENALKPKALGAQGSNQLNHETSLGHISDKQKADNWKQMQKILSGK